MAIRLTLLAVLVTLVAASCGSDDTANDSDTVTTTLRSATTTTPVVATTTTTAALTSDLPQTEQEMCAHIQEFFDNELEWFEAYNTIEEDYLTGITAVERVEYASLMRSATTSTCPLLKTYAGDDGGILYKINS